jgi:hypothetical protein
MKLVYIILGMSIIVPNGPDSSIIMNPPGEDKTPVIINQFDDIQIIQQNGKTDINLFL